MGMRRSAANWCIVLALALAMPAVACAQSRIVGLGPTEPAEPDLGPSLSEFESGVSFIDSVLPRSTLRLRFDGNNRNLRPTRSEFLFPADGFRQPETRISTQELETYVEYGLNPWFSTYMYTPFKWVDPEQNRNLYGVGDLHFGMKFAGWNSETLATAFQLEFGANTSQRVLTGTGHWSIEPGLLINWRVMPYLTVEGEAAYWVSLGGTDFEGDVFKYGLGLTYGARNSDAMNLLPVAELIGWTVTGGKEMIVTSPGAFRVESAAGETILNACFGLRFTLGHAGDIYAGYSRCLTSSSWYRDMMRVEFRLFY